jgi:hypothetical protein
LESGGESVEPVESVDGGWWVGGCSSVDGPDGMRRDTQSARTVGYQSPKNAAILMVRSSASCSLA